LEDRCLPSVTLFAVPSANTEPEGISRGPDGNLYFAEIHAIGRITPGGGSGVEQMASSAVS
jgi:hypothetical protein